MWTWIYEIETQDSFFIGGCDETEIMEAEEGMPWTRRWMRWDKIQEEEKINQKRKVLERSFRGKSLSFSAMFQWSVIVSSHETKFMKKKRLTGKEKFSSEALGENPWVQVQRPNGWWPCHLFLMLVLRALLIHHPNLLSVTTSPLETKFKKKRIIGIVKFSSDALGENPRVLVQRPNG